MWGRQERGGLLCRVTFTIINGITAIYWLHGTFLCMGAIEYAHTDVDFINKLLSYSVFNVTGNEVAEEWVYIRRQPNLGWGKAFLSSLLSGKAKDCPQVLSSDKKYPSVGCGHLPTYWKLTDFHQTPRPETEQPSMGGHHPQFCSERERENYLPSGDHVTSSTMYYLYCKTPLVYQVQIY